MYKTFEEFMSPVEVKALLGNEYAYADLEPETIEDHKFLANYYETSLGHIKLLDPAKHLYSITTEDRTDFKIALYTKKNADKIKDNAYKYFMSGLEESLKDLKYPVIESVGQINIYSYLNDDLLEANFKQKFNIEKFLNQYKLKAVKNDFYLFEL